MIKSYNLGYPEVFGTCHIGLYQPVFNCFLLTLCDYLEAQEVMLIAASRYNLIAVDLTSASNYCPNIIDNDCCENWCVPLEESFTEIFYHNFLKRRSVQRLLPRHNTDSQTCLEKEYLQTVWYYTRFFSKILPEKNPGMVYHIKRFLSDTFDLHDSRVESIESLRRAVIKELYITQNIKQSELYINNLIAAEKNKHDLIF
jgi:hypothetical protein